MKRFLPWTGAVSGRFYKRPGRNRVLLMVFVLLLLSSGTDALSDRTGNPSLKSAVDLREGPGSYFPMVARLTKSAPIRITEESDGWSHIQSGDNSGWIPNLAVSSGSGEDSGDEFQSMRDRFDRAFDDSPDDSETQVSEAQVVAAVKGFVENHIAAVDKSLVDYTDHFIYSYNPRAYRQFRDSRISQSEWRRAKRNNRLSWSDIPDPRPELDMIGWAAGNRIAQIGIYEEPQLRKYLNHIAMLVTESSHRPDLAVNVIVLDTDDIVGYAVPGGLIFVSRGAVGIMRTEAEFAAFIGHEIAHLAFQHGEMELTKRGTRIRADNATRRMDQAIADAGMQDERYIEITRELQQVADDLFEYLIADRLYEYEEESDYYGMVYASRSGYRGEALYNTLERISLFKREPADDRKSAWYGDTMQKRLEALRGQISGYNMRQGEHHAAPWESRTGHLRTDR